MSVVPLCLLLLLMFLRCLLLFIVSRNQSVHAAYSCFDLKSFPAMLRTCNKGVTVWTCCMVLALKYEPTAAPKTVNV